MILNLNRYAKKEKIGEGGNGEIFRIEDRNTNESFAAKISLREIDPASEDMIALAREVNNTLKLNHPTIIKLIGYSQTDFNNDNKPVIVTEYFPNKSLFEVLEQIRQGTAIPEWNDTKKLINIYGIAVGMQYSHANNLIHRDLKTLNILVDEYLYPRITDFGYSKILHQNLDSMSIQSASDYKGTMAYFSPEIWDSKNYSKSSDVYAFGFIVYEIITGDLPFINMSSIDIHMMVANGRRPPFRNEIPECYKDLIKRCWAQDPDQRPTFDEIVTLLRENEEFVTETVNADEYLNYRDFIDEAVKSFNSNKQIIFLDEFMIQRNRNVPQRINLAEKKSFSNFFGLFNREYKPKKIFPEDKFAILSPNCQNLVTQALTNFAAQFVVGKHLIEGTGNFPKSIEIGVKYLKESSSHGYLDSVLYYANMLMKGDIVPQDIESAKKCLSKYLKEDDSRIHLLYGKIMKKQKNYAESMKHFEISSSGGNNESMYEYAKMLFNAKSTPQDIETALNHLKISKTHGNKKSERFLAVFNRLKEIEGFERLPYETQKLFILQTCKNENNENQQSKATIKPKNVQMLYNNHSLDSPDFANMLRRFETVDITLDYAAKNYSAIHGKIEIVKHVIPSIVVHLIFTDIKKINNELGPDSIINEIIISPSTYIIKEGAFHDFTNLTKITIPSSIKAIKASTFHNCSSLTEIAIPTSVTIIEKCAFMGCSSLREVFIPSSIKSIGESAFEQCTSLAQVSIPFSITTIETGLFKNCTSLTQIEIPPSVTSIGDWSFENCSSLAQVSIPASVLLIKCNTFKGCTSLTEITIPQSVTSIGGGSFENCSSLAQVSIPASILSIKNRSFKGCTSLTEITIPQSVTSIEHHAFHGCRSLSHVTIESDSCEIDKYSFDQCESFTLTGNANIQQAFYNIGDSFETSRGQELNLSEACRYYKISAVSGLSLAMFKYGKMLFNGTGVETNKVEANRYFKMAAENGDTNAMNMYGINLETGSGVSANLREANRYYKMAADLGHYSAMFNYAVNLENGKGVTVNLAEATRYFKMAAQGGDVDAMYNYAWNVGHGRGTTTDLKTANRYYKMAADNGHSKAMYFYAVNLDEGKGTAVDYAEATRYFKMSAQKGDIDAMYRYAFNVEHGRGTTADIRTACQYYEMAADKKHVNSSYEYGLCLESGSGVAANLREASRYIKFAADNGNTNAMNKYGIMLEYGKGVPITMNEACVYYKRAADQNNIHGMHNYADMLEFGKGISQNKEEAKRYFKMAADRGHQESLERYNRLNNACLIY